MEDIINSLENGKQTQSSANGRRPQYLGQWKLTSIIWKMEDNLKMLAKGRFHTPPILCDFWTEKEGILKSC